MQQITTILTPSVLGKKTKISLPSSKWKHYFSKRKIKLELLGKQIYNFLINAWND